MQQQNSAQEYDLVIIGAGLSGIGTAYWLQDRCPDKRYIILESRETMGGTWDLFRYPGIRSDSDMFTLGYAFRPWQDGKAIADGPSILRYIKETAEEYGIDRHIRYGHKLLAADWHTEDAVWVLEVEQKATGERLQLRTRFLSMCSGYYNYEQAYRPDFPGEQAYRGSIVQPQFWPRELDYAGKRVVVIGSGATAVTIVPAMTDKAAHVTMLQRSPTYVMSLPGEDTLYRRLARWLPQRLAYELTRWRNLLFGMAFFKMARAFPEKTKQFLLRQVARQLRPDFPLQPHFTPTYKPWDQRLCIVPDGDLFAAVNAGKAEIVTDEIDHFTETGLQLASGRRLEADIVVMATGLKIKILGGANFHIDGQQPDTRQLMAYKGMMLSDIPNMAIAFGYTNASWTLKTDLTASYICRLLHYMDRHGHEIVVARPDPDVTPEPFLDFDSGYVKRASNILPQQGSRRPWRVYQNYLQDMLTIRYGRIADKELYFGKKGQLP